MSTNNFIVSGEGFLSGIHYNRETFEHEFEWTKLLRKSFSFKTSSANKTIERHKLNAWVWNPYVQEPVRGAWEVLRRRYYEFGRDEEKEEIYEYYPSKVSMKSDSDVEFIRLKNIPPKEYVSYDEAVKLSHKKNKHFIEQLEKIQEELEFVIKHGKTKDRFSDIRER